MTTVTTTLQLLATLEDKVSPGLKGIGGNAEATEQKLGRMRATLDVQARSMALAQKELKSLQSQYAAAAGKATELSDKIDRLDTSTAKGAATAGKLQAELDKVSASALRTATAIERKEIALQRGSNAMQRLAQDAARTASALNEEAKEISKSGSSMQVLATSHAEAGSGMGGLITKLGTLAASFATLAVVAGTVDWAKQGAAMEGVADSFDKLAAGAGTTGDALLAAMQKASKGTIADADLMAKANQAVLLSQGRFATELPRLLEGARASAKATGKDVSTAFDDIVTAAARGSAEIADNLGFTVNAAQAYKDYADSLGISVDALTNQQKQMAFTDALLTQSDALVKQLGDDTLTNADKIAIAETKWKNFTNQLKGFAAEGVSGAIDGLTYLGQVLAGNGGGDQQAQAIAATAQSYEQYVAAIKSGDEAMLHSTTSQQLWLNSLGPLGPLISGIVGTQQVLVGQTEIMSRAQFEASQALQEVGYSAEQANAMVAGLAGQQTILTTVTGTLASVEGMDAEAKKAMIDRTVELASASPEAASEIAGLIEQVVTGEMTGLEYADALAIMSAESGGASQAALDLANSLLVQNDATAGTTQSTWDMIDSTYEQEMANLNAAIAAEESARFHEDLAWAADMTAHSADGAAAASAYLVSVYGLEIDQVNALTAATNQLNLARAGKMGNAAGRKAGGLAKQIVEGPGGAAGYHARSVDRAERAERARGGGGSGRKAGGGSKAKGGKSEEVKQAEQNAKELKKIDEQVAKAKTDYQRKVEDAAQAHADKLQAIDEEYFQKNLEATNKFNADKFDTQLDFWGSIKDIDAEFYDQARAAEDAYWQESQAMAQAGHAEQAAELYEAGTELARIQAENAQEMKDLRAQIAEEEDADERAKLEQQLARQAEYNAREEQLAADKVKKIREGGDQLEQERQDAIAKENEDYSEAQNSLKEDFAETLEDIKTSYADMSDGVRQVADSIVAAAQLATDAINSIPTVPGGQAVPVEARAMGGPISRGRPYLVGEHGPELVVPRQSGRVVDAERTAMLGRGVATGGPLANLSPAAAGGGSSSTSTTTAQINAPITIGGTNAAPADIQRAVAAGIRQGLDEFNRRTGGRANSTQKMGGRR